MHIIHIFNLADMDLGENRSLNCDFVGNSLYIRIRTRTRESHFIANLWKITHAKQSYWLISNLCWRKLVNKETCQLPFFDVFLWKCIFPGYQADTLTSTQKVHLSKKKFNKHLTLASMIWVCHRTLPGPEKVLDTGTGKRLKKDTQVP